MEARWTLADVRAELAKVGAGEPLDFSHTLMLVTQDSVMVIDGAIMTRLGDYYLVWTEHHGDFVEHKDEVIECRIYKRIS